MLIDFPPRSVPRYGYGKPPHPWFEECFERGRSSYRSLLERFLTYQDAFRAIPARGSRDDMEPHWINDFLPGLDAAALYALLSIRAPRRYVEIGSGNSTRFANRAIRDQRLPTEIISIDPNPRASVGGLVTMQLRVPLEDVQLPELFGYLGPGDFLFFDGSHRCLTNSDVTVLFLDVLPGLPEGVIVHLHDIFLPYDYPPDWGERHYSEQYVLAAYLLGGSAGSRVLLPSAFVSQEPELAHILDPIWDTPELVDVERHGCSFWFETGAPTGRVSLDTSP